MEKQELSLGKSKIPRISKDYDLVGGLTIRFREPVMGDFSDASNLVVLSKMLVSIGNSSLVDQTEKARLDMIRQKNSALTAAMIDRMNDFLKDKATIEKEELTDEIIISDLFKKDTVERVLTISHGTRKIVVKIGIPKTSETDIIGDELPMGTYIKELDELRKTDYETEEWNSIIEDIPYLLAKTIPVEYWKLFDKSTALILNNKKMLDQIENF